MQAMLATKDGLAFRGGWLEKATSWRCKADQGLKLPVDPEGFAWCTSDWKWCTLAPNVVVQQSHDSELGSKMRCA